MKLKLYTLAGNHQGFHYLTGKHKTFNFTVIIIFIITQNS